LGLNRAGQLLVNFVAVIKHHDQIAPGAAVSVD
jgi:hypothetical protein